MCLQGGIHGKISLTAYVVAALLETGINTEVSRQKCTFCQVVPLSTAVI